MKTIAELDAETRERAGLRADAYWKNPPPTRTEEQEREHQRARAEVAKWARCPISQVVWHGPDQAWTFR